jgi:hypothetical protein
VDDEDDEINHIRSPDIENLTPFKSNERVVQGPDIQTKDWGCEEYEPKDEIYKVFSVIV